MAWVAQGWAGATSEGLRWCRAPRAKEASAVASPHALRTSPAPGCVRAPPRTDVARLRAEAKAPDPEAGPRKPAASRGRRAGREEGRGRVCGGWVFGGGDVEEVTPRPGRCQTSRRGTAVAAGSRALQLRQAALPRAAAAETPSPKPQLPSPAAPRALGQREREAAERLQAGGPRARPRAAGREAGGPGPWPCPGPGRGPGPGGGGSPRGSRGAGTPAERRRGHGSREHHHAARPAGGRR